MTRKLSFSLCRPAHCPVEDQESANPSCLYHFKLHNTIASLITPLNSTKQSCRVYSIFRPGNRQQASTYTQLQNLHIRMGFKGPVCYIHVKCSRFIIPVFSLVYNQLKNTMVVFPLPENESFRYMEQLLSMEYPNVTTVENEQTLDLEKDFHILTLKWQIGVAFRTDFGLLGPGFWLVLGLVVDFFRIALGLDSDWFWTLIWKKATKWENKEKH